MAITNNTPAKLNQVTQAKNDAQASYMSDRIYGGAIFFAYGHARVIGSGQLQVLSNVYLDGLGPLWSATYVLVTVEHSVSENEGYICDIDVAANSLGGTSDAKQAAQAASVGGTAAQQESLTTFYDQNPYGSGPGPVQSPLESITNPLPATDPLSTITGGVNSTGQGTGVGN